MENLKKILKNAQSMRCDVDKLIQDIEHEMNGAVSFMGDVRTDRELATATIQDFIDKRIGIFKCDLLSIDDMRDEICLPEHTEKLLVAASYFTARNIGLLRRNLSGVSTVTVSPFHKPTLKLSILRKCEKYHSMSGAQVCEEYQLQVADYRGECVI